jgi:hypothetical protein
MSTDDDRSDLEARILILQEHLKDGQVSPDTAVAALAAILQAQALALLSDTLHATVNTLVHDGMRPLMMRLPPQ